MLKTRQGAVPAVIAAPITSSLLLPAGISWPSTCWSALAAFQLATMALPQATSCSLLEYQMVIGPLAAVASVPEAASSPPQAASDRLTVRVAVSARAFSVRRCTVFSSCDSGGGDCGVGWGWAGDAAGGAVDWAIRSAAAGSSTSSARPSAISRSSVRAAARPQATGSETTVVRAG